MIKGSRVQGSSFKVKLFDETTSQTLNFEP